MKHYKIPESDMDKLVKDFRDNPMKYSEYLKSGVEELEFQSDELESMTTRLQDLLKNPHLSKEGRVKYEKMLAALS